MKNWFTIGIGVKRWLIMLGFSAMVFGLGVSVFFFWLADFSDNVILSWMEAIFPLWITASLLMAAGIGLGFWSIMLLVRVVTSPFRKADESLANQILFYQQRNRGPKIVAIGGGTGLSNLLRGLTEYSNNITAIVTVADDGGSSGRLRREFGVLPPGDFRNNIAALSRDEALMTQLLQYRFGGSDDDSNSLSGHAFGNLLITALVGLTGSFEDALLATRKVLSIRGQVLPSTLTPVNLIADIQVKGKLKKVFGESSISHENGIIRKIDMTPEGVRAYPEAVRAILAADLVILGPGSLFTSIVPNLLVKDIARAVESASGHVTYVCNVSSQSGETDNYTVSDHVKQLGNYLDLDGIGSVVANNHIVDRGKLNGQNAIRLDHFEGMNLVEADLIDSEKPWMHDSKKLASCLVRLLQ
ncbi:MAG: uridine diphosphate-N-acetylglucosamine-binding protein YvcK [Anaerolineae bacterium]